MNNFGIIILFFVCIGNSLLIAQSGTLRGHIVDKENGQPIPYASIEVVSINESTLSDGEGFFNLVIEAGNYEVLFKYLGFKNEVEQISVQAGVVEYVKIALSPTAFELTTIEVSARKAIRQTETNLASARIDRNQILKLPSFTIQGDIAQYLSILPGVVSSGEQGGQIFISGGSTHQNLTFIDGITIIQPFHSLSGFSIIPTEMIQDVSVHGAAFDATYGGRVSSVMDIHLRRSLPVDWEGSASIDPFVGQVFLQGPIWTSTSNKDLGVGISIGAKKSLIDKAAKTLYQYIDGGVPFGFEDVTAKIVAQTSNGNSLSVTGLFATDAIDLSEDERYHWSVNGIGLNFRLLPPTSSLVISGQVGYSTFESNLNTMDPRSSKYAHFRGMLQMDYYGTNSQLTYGFQLEGAQTDFTFLNFANITFNQQDNTSDISGFIKYKSIIKKLILEGGARLIYYASLGNLSLEPRLGMKYPISDLFRLKAGGGLYSQNFVLAKKDEDVVNFFNAFISSPDGQLSKLDGTIANNNLQKSLHGLLGIEIDIADRWSLDIEVYRKYFTQLIELNRNKINIGDRDFTIEEGQSHGANISIEFQHKHFMVNGSYSWLKASRKNNVQTYPAPFDRRNQANIYINYSVKNNWNISARWSIGSGFPFTRTQGFYDRILFEDGIAEDLVTSNGDLGIIYEDLLNQGRLPYFHRLDFSANRVWEIREIATFELGVSLINIYDRANIFYFDRIQYNRVDQFPFIPSLGLKITF